MTGAISLTGSGEPDPLKICEGDKLGSLTALLCRERLQRKLPALARPSVLLCLSLAITPWLQHPESEPPAVSGEMDMPGDALGQRCIC